MLSRLKQLYHAILTLSSNATRRDDLELLKCNLSPIDRHVVLSGIIKKSGLFHPSYDGWRVKRIDKILEIYGVDFFKSSKILEVGAGHGDIGAFLADLGSEVVCLDGRIQNVNFAKLKHRNVGNITFEQFNLERDFSSFGKFDLLINFGVLYHIRNVDVHLKACFATADDIVIETVVCDSTDPYKLILRDERPEVDEEALEGIGSRPSPFYIERIANENNFRFDRHFTADLNFGDQFSYDWEHKNNDEPNDDFRRRRMWRLTKIEDLS